MTSIRAFAILGLLAAGCSSDSPKPGSPFPPDLASHFERGGTRLQAEEEEGSLPGGASQRWKVEFQDPIRKRLGFDGSGHVFLFTVSRMAEDYSQALEGTRDQAKASGRLVLVLRKPRHGFTDMSPAAVPATAGLKEAWTRWHALAGEAPSGDPPASEAAREAVEAGQRLFDQEWASCVSELFALFSSFAPEAH